MLKAVHADQCELLFDHFIQILVAFDAAVLTGRKGDILINGQAVKQRPHLKAEAISGANIGELCFVQIVDASAPIKNFSGCRPLQRDQVFHKYGLSTAGRADDGGGFAFLNSQ
jgi:hypothetical protein